MVLKNREYVESLLKELIKLPCETEWIEFKVNKSEPQMIGEYISALSNAAALLKKSNAYLIWGIDDKTHEIIGTDFNYRLAKKGNEELESWLSRLLEPKINFKFNELFIGNKKIVILDIDKAITRPISFMGQEFIRIGSNKKKLKDYPEKERELWRVFDENVSELRIAKHNLSFDEVLDVLDFVSYYRSLGFGLPKNKDKIESDFLNEKFIIKTTQEMYDITNLGALLLARDVTKFETIAHKYVRVIWYKDKSKLETIREQEFLGGYILEYENIINYIMTIIPQEEVIENSIRKSKFSYPEIAIREIVANILIHQDIEKKGTSPMVEVFSNRIEFSNLGAPLVSIDRIIDTVPLSRNESIAKMMRKCGICEERGSGYDKIINSLSEYNLLAPKIENQNNQFTKVTLYSKIPFELINKEDKIRTCYMYACLMYIYGEAINNNSIRKIFGLDEKYKYKISRVIKDTLEKGLIKIVDENTAPRYMKYVPFWV